MARFRKGKRSKQRTKMVVPVRVTIAGIGHDAASEVAHTLDATETGVRLAGLRSDVSPGDVIEIRYRHERALFRVVWIRALEKSPEKHIGAECIEPDKNIWRNEFSEETDEYEEQE